MTNKELYHAHCQLEDSIPIFSQPWWLDTVSGANNWDVVLVKNKEKISASLPYVLRRRYGFKFIEQPNLTPFLGPWLRTSHLEGTKKLSLENELLDALIENLPSFDHYGQNWHHANQNWLSFYWAGFKQTTHYSYRINCLQNLESVWKNLQPNVKSDIKKARDRYSIVIDLNGSIEDFIALNKKTFERQNMTPPYPDSFLRRLNETCSEQNCHKILIAKDSHGAPHAGAFIVWDKTSAYYLIGGGDPELRSSGATSLCIWEAICFSASVTKSFDFEGSMIKPIEKFFRAFGGVPTPYFAISKTKSAIVRIKHFLGSFR